MTCEFGEAALSYPDTVFPFLFLSIRTRPAISSPFLLSPSTHYASLIRYDSLFANLRNFGFKLDQSAQAVARI